MSSTDARCTARRYYAAYGRDLQEDMAALGANPQGVVVFSPRLVALVKPVLAAAPRLWGDLAVSPAGADAWYIHLLCGDLRHAAMLAGDLPPLRRAVFQRGVRGPRVHSYPWRRLLLYFNHTTNH